MTPARLRVQRDRRCVRQLPCRPDADRLDPGRHRSSEVDLSRLTRLPAVSSDVTHGASFPGGAVVRYSQLSRPRQGNGSGFFVGVPTAIHILFVWVPAISTIALSFTEWDGLRLGTWKLLGFQNYWAVFTDLRWQVLPGAVQQRHPARVLVVLQRGRRAVRLPARQEHSRHARSTRASTSCRWCCRWRSSASSGRA